jgi:uncharacterized membrane protein (DUF485 family)
MGGLDFKATGAAEQEEAHVVAHNTRLGLALFAVYVLFYGGFMALSAFRPEVMGRPFLGGVNLSVAYGFALIVAALLLAGVYLALSRKPSEGGAS